MIPAKRLVEIRRLRLPTATEAAELVTAYEALQELVELKDAKDKLDAERLYPGKFYPDDAARYAADLDYRERKPKAWRAARTAIFPEPTK